MKKKVLLISFVIGILLVLYSHSIAEDMVAIEADRNGGTVEISSDTIAVSNWASSFRILGFVFAFPPMFWTARNFLKGDDEE